MTDHNCKKCDHGWVTRKDGSVTPCPEVTRKRHEAPDEPGATLEARPDTWEVLVLKSDLSATQKLVALTIGTFLPDQGTGAFPGHNLIAERASLSRTVTNAAIGKLRAQGWLHIAGEPKKGQPTTYAPAIPK